MEYARRRSRRRKEGGGAGKALVALLLIGGIIYLVCASEAGSWISKNVIAPVIEAFRPEEAGAADKAEEAAPASAEAEGEVVSLSTGLSSVTETVSLPGAACYALQMGVFSVEENAEAAASALKKEGGAGYVLEDAGRYRVLASGYLEEAGAQEVKERLVQEGRDCTVFKLETKEAAFRVSATREQLAGVREGFSALGTLQEGLTRAALEFDRGQALESGKAAARDLLTAFREDVAFLEGYGGDSPAIREILNCCEGCAAALEELSAYTGQSTVDFSSELKYTQLYTTDEYRKLMENLS